MDEADKTGLTVGELQNFFDSGGRTIEDHGPDAGRPRKNTKPTGLKVGELPPELQGTPTDPETGKLLVPDLIRDNDLNPNLVGLTVEEIIAFDIRRIEEGDDGRDPNAVDDRLLQPGFEITPGSSSGNKIPKPKPKAAKTYNANLSDDGRKCHKCGESRRACGCYEGRSEFVGARVNTQAKDFLASSSVSAGEIVQAVVEAAIAAKIGPGGIGSILKALEGQIVTISEDESHAA